VASKSDNFRPLGDLSYLGKLSDYGDIHRVLREYHQRTGLIPSKLDLPDRRSKATLDLLKKLTPESVSYLNADRATWYTKLPVPYNSRLSNILSETLPTKHMAIILADMHGNLVDDFNQLTGLLNPESLRDDKEENAEWWKTRTQRKTQSILDKRKEYGEKVVATLLNPSLTWASVTMDDWGEVLARIDYRLNPPPGDDEPIIGDIISYVDSEELIVPDWAVATIDEEISPPPWAIDSEFSEYTEPTIEYEEEDYEDLILMAGETSAQHWDSSDDGD